MARRECKRRPWPGRPSSNRSAGNGFRQYTAPDDSVQVAEAMLTGSWRIRPDTVGALLAAITDEATVERFAFAEVRRTTWWVLLDERVDDVEPIEVELALRWFFYTREVPVR